MVDGSGQEASSLKLKIKVSYIGYFWSNIGFSYKFFNDIKSKTWLLFCPHFQIPWPSCSMRR